MQEKAQFVNHVLALMRPFGAVVARPWRMATCSAGGQRRRTMLPGARRKAPERKGGGARVLPEGGCRRRNVRHEPG